MSSGDDYAPSAAKRKRARPKAEFRSGSERIKSEEEMDGIHYACNVCDQVFLHKSNYLRHSLRHNYPGGFICSLCYQPFTTDWDRNKHKREEHSVFRCRLCKEEFPIEDDYNHHIQVKHEGRDREYDVCPTCGQQFRSTSQLKVHIESRCGRDKKHECTVCHSRYMTQASLNAHMIKHLGEKSHLCNYCGASFLNKGQLKVHERMHTGEKPYKCNQCDKAFAHRESLITHSTTHTGIKPYYCSYCESRFSCVGNLLKHRRARVDTCGLPQYCQTNKITPRPNIKTMPNLTDRQVYTQKVVQRCVRKAKEVFVDFKPRPKKRLGRKPTTGSSMEESDEDDYSDEEEPFEEKPSQQEEKAPPTEKQPEDTKPLYQKLVDLKVEPGEYFFDYSVGSNNVSRKKMSSTVNIEVVEIKVEDDSDASDADNNADEKVNGESEQDTVEFTVEYDDMEDMNDETIYCENDGYEENLSDSNDPCNDNNEDRMETGSERNNQSDGDVSEGYSPANDGTVNVRRKFENKPPVITERRRRGRPRKIVVPKQDTEDMIIIDVARKQRELKKQRAVFDEHVQSISIDCFRCNNCPSQFTSEYLIGRHLEREHGISLKELLETLQYGRISTREKRFQCRYCHRLYANEKVLEKHVLLHGPSGTSIHKCPCCSKYYETENEAHAHAMEEHRDRLECSVCEKVFKGPEGLIGHVKYFHKGYKETKHSTHVCPKCGKQFSTRTAVTDHERANCGKNPLYQCEMCLKNFHSSSSLKNHYTLHTDKFLYSCQFCGKSYRTNGQVKVHERSHTGEKPFACEFCPKAFAHRESLHTHRSLHTGVKRFMCSGCGLRFTCISNLQAHRRSHKTTCGSMPNVTQIMGPAGSGYHDIPPGYSLPFPRIQKVE
ncbi:zinc finger protein 624-like [Toxorhynchites rutilus septentrionalis]|uniref:zinc finger protein 624-like n=1 Tax=Toxorhynchites rutilus septentrionalis TaxID=329112 RepID=UPI00247B2237|nr:zinc finger protein 624-like [Toxorhynchites rutilus septentrionalis]